jgi:3-methyl-2-oxobutanoate hydroxymethyltransferase
MVAVTINALHELKKHDKKFPVITAYDASFSRLAHNAGIDVILVGDSLGNVVQGHDSTIPVTMGNMIYHTEAVRRGSAKSFVIADLPFMAFSSEAQTLDHSALLIQAGANMVKLEGGAWLCNTVQMLSERGIPICGHLGLTPQSVHKLSGNKVQGRGEEATEKIIQDALRLEEAGVDLLVLECVPSTLGSKLTAALNIPIIGIGAGVGTDAQVLVVYDMLGLSPSIPTFCKNFLEDTDNIEAALKSYAEDVRSGRFPGPEHTFS